jgi:UDP-glucose 4-epimerase
MKRKNALVTGGAGFVGSFLVEKLVKKNYQVTVVDNLSTGSRDNIKNVSSKIRFIRQDLEKFLNQNRDLSAYDYIFHLAANPYIPPSVKNPRFDFRQNFLNTFNLLENLRKSTKAPHLLNTSSAAVYGNPETLPIKETDPTVPISPYGASKLSAEHYAAVYSKLYNLKITNMRFFPVFGPRQKKQVIFDLILKIKRNPEVLEIFGDGSQSRDFRSDFTFGGKRPGDR